MAQLCVFLPNIVNPVYSYFFRLFKILWNLQAYYRVSYMLVNLLKFIYASIFSLILS